MNTEINSNRPKAEAGQNAGADPFQDDWVGFLSRYGLRTAELAAFVPEERVSWSAAGKATDDDGCSKHAASTNHRKMGSCAA